MSDMPAADVSHNGPMTDTSQRDELMEAIEAHPRLAVWVDGTAWIGCPCFEKPGGHAYPADHRMTEADWRAHLADVLLAAGWSKADESEVAWGVRCDAATCCAGHSVTNFYGSEEAARICADAPSKTLVLRSQGPWQEVE